ncbi:MAG: hypothetical protein [Bacteriophage sp.]|nr:MAG: hypothetical protein [Bacteriophage sp.]
MRELTIANDNLVSYDKYLAQLLIKVPQDFTPEPDELYYFKVSNPRYGKRVKNLYIKARAVMYYYADKSTAEHWGITSTRSKVVNKPLTAVTTSGDELNCLCFIRFKVLGVYYSKEKLLSKSKLKGFGRVIDDNEYFSRIPIINELTHWDNGVLTSNNFKFKATYDKPWDVADSWEEIGIVWYDNNSRGLKKPGWVHYLKDWDKFQLTATNNHDGEKRISLVGGEGHEKL